MLDFFRTVVSKIIAWFKPTDLAVNFHQSVEEPISRKSTSVRADAEENGRFYHFSGILDRLDEYFEEVRYLKKVDPDAYDFFSKIGSVVHPRQVLWHETVKDPLRRVSGKLPGALSVFMPSFVNDGFVGPSIIHIRKITGFKYVERSNHPSYEASILWRERVRGGDLAYGTFYFCVADDGSCRPLKELRVRRQHIREGKKNQYTVPHKSYQHNQYVEERSAELGESKEKFVSMLFGIVFDANVQAESGMEIIVSKSGINCRFAIDMLRTPYFFKDRDIYVNENGKKKRIFHYVKPHTRRGKTIKSHFRGLRKFQWNGYNVTITMPGKHHAGLFNFDGASLETEMENVPTMSARSAGQQLIERMKA